MNRPIYECIAYDLGNELEDLKQYKKDLEKYTDFIENQQAEQLILYGVVVSEAELPDNKELNLLKNEYPASGGDAGWIQEAYKKGYVDGWNKKPSKKINIVKGHKPKGN